MFYRWRGRAGVEICGCWRLDGFYRVCSGLETRFRKAEAFDGGVDLFSFFVALRALFTGPSFSVLAGVVSFRTGSCDSNVYRKG